MAGARCTPRTRALPLFLALLLAAAATLPRAARAQNCSETLQSAVQGLLGFRFQATRGVPFTSFEADIDSTELYAFFNITLQPGEVSSIEYRLGFGSVLDRGFEFDPTNGVISGTPRDVGSNYADIEVHVFPPTSGPGARKRRMPPPPPPLPGGFGGTAPPPPGALGKTSLPPLYIDVKEAALLEDTEQIALLTMYIGEYFEFTPRLATNRTQTTAFSLVRTLPPGITLNTTTGVISGVPTNADEYDDGIIVIRQEGSQGSFLILEVGEIDVVGEDCDEEDNGPNGLPCLNGGLCVDNVTFDGAYTCLCPADTVLPNCQLPSASSDSSASEDIRLGVSISAGVFAFFSALVILYLFNRYNSAKIVPLQQYIPPPVDEWEFDRARLFDQKYLGEGNFGTVIKATTASIRGRHGGVIVAVKKCGVTAGGAENRKEQLSLEPKELPSDPLQRTTVIEQMRRFVNEANAMKRFDHPHVLCLLGVCLQDAPLCVITEFMENGDLHNFLRAHHEIQVKGLTNMAADVSSGLAYLHSQKFVHGDLACRNCLVNENMVVKISDFGMSKDTSYKGYYHRASSQNVPVPVRWMAPECLKFGEYTTQGDVWSLGVLIWELMTHCEMPYPALGNQEVFDKVVNGYRMPKPPLAPPAVYEVMTRCWAASPRRRPQASEIMNIMQGISDAIEVAPVRQRRVSWSRMTPELKGNTAATNGTQRRGSLALASREDANSTPAPNPPQKARRRSGALTAPDMRRPSQVESVEETDADGGGSEYVTLAQQQQRNSGPAMYSAGHDTAMYVPPEQQRQQQQQQQQQVQSPGGAMYTPVAAQAGNGTLYTPVEAQGGVNGDMYTPVEAQGGQPAPELYDPVEATGFHGAIALHGPASRAQASAAAPGVIEFERPGGAAECRVSMMTDDCGGSQRQHSEAVDAQSPLSPSPSANNYGRYLSDKEMQELAASDGLARAASRDTLRTQLTETDL